MLLQTGAAFLHETFTKDSTLETSFTTSADIERMKDYILKQMQPIEKLEKVPLIYGSTCIIDLMKKIGLPLDDHFQSSIHPYKTYKEHLEMFIKKVLPLNYGDREKKYPFQYGYMWGIDKAFINVVTMAEYFESPYIIPSNANIAKGLVYEMV